MTDDPIGGVIRNLVTLKQLENTTSLEAKSIIDDLFEDIAGQIARLDPTAPARERYRRERLQKLLGEVDGLVGSSISELRTTLQARLASIGAQQATWAGEHLGRVIGEAVVDIRSGRLGAPFFRSILTNDPFEGETLAGWARMQGFATKHRIRRQLQLGMSLNETLDDMVRRIRGRRSGNGFVGGVFATTTREAEALARTGVNFIANRGHLATYQENADVLSAMMITAVLDRRTTEICMALDGTRVDVVDPDPKHIPPFHWRCRTVLTPVVDWEGLGIEPPPEATRASEFGQVPSSQTYDDFLRNQSDAYQDEVLGPGRAQLYREKKVSLSELIREDRSLIPISELRTLSGNGAGGPAPPVPAFPAAAEIAEQLESIERDTGADGLPRMKQELRDMNERFTHETFRAAGVRAEFGSTSDEYANALDELEELKLSRERLTAKIARTQREYRGRQLEALKRAEGDRTALRVKNNLRSGREKIDAGEEAFRSLVSSRWLAGESVTIKRTRRGRSFATVDSTEIHMSSGAEPRVMVHELGHILEDRHPEIHQAALAFRARRTKGEKPKRLKDLFPYANYAASEVTLPDEFVSPYVGKIYPEAWGATEVIAMGIERMADDALDFWRNDADHFELIWTIMNGALP